MIKPVMASDIREIARGHGAELAGMVDSQHSAGNLAFDDLVAVASRQLVESSPIFWHIVHLGTGATLEELAAMSWAQVVKLGCAVIEETRDAWREAWPNGFLQRIVIDELAAFSTTLRRAN